MPLTFKSNLLSIPRVGEWIGVGLSESPSLLISGSGSWLQLAFAAENIKNLLLGLRAREKI